MDFHRPAVLLSSSGLFHGVNMIIDGHHHIEAGHREILAYMDALGIDKTVLIGVGVSDLSVVTVRDVPVLRSDVLLRTLGVAKMRRLVRSRVLQDVLLGDPLNDRVLDAMKAEPDRFLGFVFVNPESERCLAEIERCLDAGMCGIKLALLQYPTDLSGPRMRKICEIARERQVPIFFHQGVTKEASDPRVMFEAFPEVTFIIAHAGVQYFREAVRWAQTKENVYIDTSSWMVTVRKLKILCREIGAEKIIFGTDVPVMAKDPSKGMDRIRQLQLSVSEEQLVLGGNLQRILGLSDR